MTILDDGVMKAETVGNWVFVRWVGEQSRRFHLKAYRDLKAVESHIRQNHLPGWIVASERIHEKMHGLFKKMGAEKYGEDQEYLFFRKEFSHVR